LSNDTSSVKDHLNSQWWGHKKRTHQRHEKPPSKSLFLVSAVPLWPLNCICTHSEAHNRLARQTASREARP
jgi:hypothetical protein